MPNNNAILFQPTGEVRRAKPDDWVLMADGSFNQLYDSIYKYPIFTRHEIEIPDGAIGMTPLWQYCDGESMGHKDWVSIPRPKRKVMAKIIELKPKEKETYNDICKEFEETMKDMDKKIDEIIYDSNEQIDWQHEIKKFCDYLGRFLCDKNIAYGNSIFEPFNVFSKSSVIEKIDTRIDDKLSRILKGKEYVGDDTDLDLIGYLVLRRIWREKGEKSK